MKDTLRRKLALGITTVVILGITLGTVGGYKLGRKRLRSQMQEAATALKELAPISAPAVPKVGDIKLFLPAMLYATPGVELSVFFDNLVDVPDANALRFKVKCPVGASARRRWYVTPTVAQEGRHPIELVVSDLKGRELGRATATIVVPPSTAGKDRSIRVLYVGDSLTHGSWHPAEMKRLAAKRGYPALSFVGTNTYGENPGIFHEAYSGWTWHCFLTHNQPGSAKKRYRDHSPFLYKTETGEPQLDVDRYLHETCPEGAPELVIFQLGINDVCSQRTAAIIDGARTLVSAFRRAAPNTALALWMTQPVNASQAAFDHVFDGKRKRADIKARQHDLAQALAKTFGGRESEGLFVIPVNLHLDPLDDYPADDAVHPNLEGYARIGQALYGWLNYWLDQAALPAKESPTSAERKNAR